MANKVTKNKKFASPYGYRNIDGVEYYGREEYDPAAKRSSFVRYGRYIAIKNIAECENGNSVTVTIEFDNLSGKRRCIDIDRSLLGKPGELQMLLLSKGADAYAHGMPVLLKCLRESERNIAFVANIHEKTGWVDENADEFAFRASTLISKDGKSTSTYGGIYDISSKGSFETWKEMVLRVVLGWIPLEIAVLIGLSPIISSLCGARNLIFHFCGDSSKGKTSAAILTVSVAGCPNPMETAKKRNAKDQSLRPLLSSWNGTTNALVKKLQGLDGTITVFDELSKLQDVKGLANIIYSISDGGDKDRLASLDSLQAVDSFRTNILSVGEESLLDKAENGNTGLRMRVCEIQTDFTKSAKQAEEIVTCCYENYGFAAPMFAKYVVENMTKDAVCMLYTKNLDAYEAALIAAGDTSNSTRRLAEFGAILLTTAEIAEKALGIPFSVTEIQRFLIDQQASDTRNQDIGIRAHTALWEYINANIAHFVVGNATDWTKSVECYGRIENCKSGTGKEVAFIKRNFCDIMKELGFNNASLIIKKFKSLGLLSYEAGKNDRKRMITKQADQTRVYVVIFPDI